MTWKLIATILAVSDSGSIATSGFVTDYPTEIGCQQIREELFRSSENIVNGRRITFKVNAVCRPVLHPPPEQRQMIRIPFPLIQ